MFALPLLLILHPFLSPGTRFSKFLKCFHTRRAIQVASKLSNVMTTERFYSYILNLKRGQDISGVPVYTWLKISLWAWKVSGASKKCGPDLITTFFNLPTVSSWSWNLHSLPTLHPPCSFWSHTSPLESPSLQISPAAWPSSDNLQLCNLGKSPSDLEQCLEECPCGEMHCGEAGDEMKT